jgi:hypothetical protein
MRSHAYAQLPASEGGGAALGQIPVRLLLERGRELNTMANVKGLLKK